MGELSKKFCKEKDIEVISKMIEIKAEFAERERERERERAIQSLKHIIYPYNEDHGKKIIPKLPQIFSTLNYILFLNPQIHYQSINFFFLGVY